MNLSDSTSGKTPLMYSASYCNQKDDTVIVKLLLNNGANPNLTNSKMISPPYMQALWYDNYECASILEKVTDFNNINLWAHDYLINAVKSNYPLIVNFLLDHGADPNLPDSVSGKTPLMFSILTDSYLFYNLLVKAGADINASDKNGLKPVPYAINSPFILLELLNNGIDANTTDDSLRTPMHHAALAGIEDSSIYQILYAFGADLNRKDLSGRAPVDINQRLKSFHPDLFQYPDWDPVIFHSIYH